MKKELEKQLQDKYPKIFVDLYGCPTKTCMSWGFEHSDGWYSLLDELCEKLQKLSDASGHQIVASQVKEKFGELHFYVNGATKEQFDLIDEAESKSLKICEFCGSTKDVSQTKSGWITTICKECLARKEKKD
jgi:hypothetical protein